MGNFQLKTYFILKIVSFFKLFPFAHLYLKVNDCLFLFVLFIFIYVSTYTLELIGQYQQNLGSYNYLFCDLINWIKHEEEKNVAYLTIIFWQPEVFKKSGDRITIFLWKNSFNSFPVR